MKNKGRGQGRKENILIFSVMCIVTLLVIVSATFAWYTGESSTASVMGISLGAKNENDLKIAKTLGGADISNLPEDERAFDIGIDELTDIEPNQIAPGAFGSVTFYITPLNNLVTGYKITPNVILDEQAMAGMDEAEAAQFLDILNRHIKLFTDNTYTTEILDVFEDNRKAGVPGSGLSWNTAADTGIEKEVTLYWKWYYEYPFTQIEIDTLTDREKKDKIVAYDLEDTQIGTMIKTIKFHFSFESIRGETT